MITNQVPGLRAQLQALKAQGQTAVDLASLENFLAAEERGGAAPGTHEFEGFKVKAPLQHAWSLSLMESGFRASEATLNWATLINGGATVALLAFLGNLAAKNAPSLVDVSVSGLSHAMLVFTVGVFLAGLGHAARYFTAFFGLKEMSAGAGLSNLAVITLSLAAIFAFAFGGYQAFASIR